MPEFDFAENYIADLKKDLNNDFCRITDTLLCGLSQTWIVMCDINRSRVCLNRFLAFLLLYMQKCSFL